MTSPFYTHFSSLPFDANSMMIIMITQTFRKTKPLLELNKVPQGHFWAFMFVCILPYSERELASLELLTFQSSGWWVSILCYRKTLLEISQTSWYPQLSQLSQECFLSAYSAASTFFILKCSIQNITLLSKNNTDHTVSLLSRFLLMKSKFPSPFIPSLSLSPFLPPSLSSFLSPFFLPFPVTSFIGSHYGGSIA